jgi:aquaporin Z
MRATWRQHLPEYLIEGAGLGLFMVSACAFTILLEHPDSTVVQALPSAFVRRALIGMAMGLTAIILIYSPWGKRSGAHFNPATTLTFYRLGKVAPTDALGYVTAQFVGGTLGMVTASLLFGGLIAHPSVSYAVTQPGMAGILAAFLAEVAIAFVMLSVVLRVSNTPPLARYTGLFAGTLVMLYITFEAPLSGMSLNPARSFASAIAAHKGNALWLYFVAPPLGMLLAAEVFCRAGGKALCAKLHHENPHRCIFCASRRG